MDPPWIDGPLHWGDPKYEEEMMNEEREENNRLAALELAVRHPRDQSATAEKIIEDAEKYSAFLKGEKADE